MAANGKVGSYQEAAHLLFAVAFWVAAATVAFMAGGTFAVILGLGFTLLALNLSGMALEEALQAHSYRREGRRAWQRVLARQELAA